MDFWNLESVRLQHRSALEFVTEQASEELRSAVLDANLESPLEAIFILWWTALGVANVMGVRKLDLDSQPSVQVGDRSYRLDFEVTPNDKEAWLAAVNLGVQYQSIGVELDGHDFHERTKEQVAHRNQRDRDLQLKGWRILHFSGSELYRCPLDVVMEVAIVATHSLNAMNVQSYVKNAARVRAEAVARIKETAPVEDDVLSRAL